MYHLDKDNAARLIQHNLAALRLPNFERLLIGCSIKISTHQALVVVRIRGAKLRFSVL
jgi:hypothetical protein